MDDACVTPEACFAKIVEELPGKPGFTPPAEGAKRRFGSSGLKVYGKIFAMLVRGRLVVKLPEMRVDTLVASGEGERFEPRRDGRFMKEWIVLKAEPGERWLALATEAMEFVGQSSRG